MSPSDSSLFPDAPISSMKEDEFGRADFARNLAKSIAGVPAEDGFVFALNAPWGSGKTSALKMVQEALREDAKVGGGKQFVTVDFNPWWFSGGDSLARDFFRQFRGALTEQGKGIKEHRDEIRKLAGHIRTFSSVLTPFPVVGEWAKLAGDMAGGVERLFPDPADNIQSVREEICNSLRGMCNKPDRPDLRVLVVMDDLDRIQPNEIREMFRLVKGVADFPNTVYLLSFDRDVVVNALAPGFDAPKNGEGQKMVGEYLDKIVQSAMPLPPVNKVVLHDLFCQDLSAAMPALPRMWDDDYWKAVFIGGIDHFVDTPRKAKRLLNNIGSAYPAVDGEVNLVDFAAIQALWTFVPEVYHVVRKNPDMFVQRSVPGVGMLEQEKQQRRKELADEISQKAGALSEPVRAILTEIFPNWSQPRSHMSPTELAKSRQRNLAMNPDIFGRYFHFSLSIGDFSHMEWNGIVACADQPDKFAKRLLQLAAEEIPTAQKRIAFRRKNASRLRVFLKRMTEHTRDKEILRHASGIVRAFLAIGDGEEVADGWNSDYMREIVCDVLRQAPDSERFEICRAAFEEGSAIILMDYLMSRLLHILEEESPHESPILRESECRALKDIVKGKLIGLARKRELHTYHCQPIHMLYLFRELVGETELHKYVGETIRSDEGFADFLVRPCREVGTRTPGGEYPYIRSDQVRDITGHERECLGARCQKILADSPAWLDESKKEALQLLIEDVEKPFVF